MEVGGLGFFNTIAASTKQPSSGSHPTTGKFMDMMSFILSGTEGKEPLEIGQTGQPGAVEDLLVLLQTTDLLEMENGLDILDELMAKGTDSLLEKVFQKTGIRREDIEAIFQKWTNLDIKELTEEELISSFSQLIASMAEMPVNHFASKLDKNDLQALKAIKMFELMSRYTDSSETENNSQLKEMLKTLENKAGMVSEQSRAFEKNDYIQARFTRLAAELNQSNSKNMIISEDSNEGQKIKVEGTPGTLAFIPQMTKAEQFSLMLHAPGRPVSAEELMKQFESILSRAQFQSSGGTQKLFIKLFPEHLGSVRVELFQKDQVMMARIITANGAAKEQLDSHINSLKQAFSAQNLQIERIEITQQTPQQDRFLNRDSQQQHRQPQQNEQEKKDENKELGTSFEEVLLNVEA